MFLIRLKNSVLALGLALAALILGSTPAVCQEESPEEIRAFIAKLKDEIRQEMGGALPGERPPGTVPEQPGQQPPPGGGPAPDPGQQQILLQQQQLMQLQQQQQALLNGTTVPEEPGVLLHVRAGRGGGPFPGPGQGKGIMYYPEEIAAWKAELLDASSIQDRTSNAPRFAGCGSSGTSSDPAEFDSRSLTPEQLRFYENQIYLDQIFLPGSTPPPNAETSLGRMADVRMVRADGSGLEPFSAMNSGANCLPFRVRITGKAVYRHWGSDALKNYDSDPNGPGTLIPN